ncbi:hypothetical protein HH310_11755 [Actinoplanes sp. TBRC 11911]|uniref:hypothetical protein n=1 Tax=Actinoplanes sp. TBRC 11911 TaxID=2729386 RepID=UPI00145D8454|nr:hypothetical protein [Actinoplanes sp. TBRC 11911]NMO51865.1 hypothetical protein [Actinoplanes sp. TBRC 11911]
MFAGLDDIDWAAMKHAYGPAEEMPSLIRGLADPDPAVREEALDAMYGAVHHQGDVYDCTVAAVPFLLEALTTPGLPGRGNVAELLASIGAYEWWPPASDGPMTGLTRQARELIATALPALSALVDDPDPQLRAGLAPLLIICAEPLAGDLLAARLGVETDPDVRRALLDALSHLGVRTGDPGVTAQLLDMATAAPDASTAVSALVALARIDPHLVPAGGVAALLERAYAETAAPARPAGFTTDTLVGAIRAVTEQANAARRAPHAARLIDSLTDALGPRVPERTAILTTLLRSPHQDITADALYGTSKLIDRWRGDHAELVRLVATHLTHPFPRMADHAATALSTWGPLTAPVADTVAAHLAALDARPWQDGMPAWTIPYHDAPGLNPALETLAELGDPRAVPYLLAALRLPRLPRNVGYLLSRYPAQAETIVPALLPALRPRQEGERPPPEWHGMHAALGAFGAASAPALPWLLSQPLDDSQARTLGRLGPAAAPAAPLLRQAMTADDAGLAVAAAEALWFVTGADDVLPSLIAQIAGPSGYAALRAVAAMGAAAEPATASVTALLADPQRRPDAAITLWQLTGDTDRTLPILAATWQDKPTRRNEIVAHARGALTAGLAPLLRAELSAPARHGLTDTGRSSRQVIDDERLLTACRAALATRA